MVLDNTLLSGESAVANSSAPQGYVSRSLGDKLYFFFGEAMLPGALLGFGSYITLSRDIAANRYDNLLFSVATAVVVTAVRAYSCRNRIIYQRNSTTPNIGDVCRAEFTSASSPASKSPAITAQLVEQSLAQIIPLTQAPKYEPPTEPTPPGKVPPVKIAA